MNRKLRYNKTSTVITSLNRTRSRSAKPVDRNPTVRRLEAPDSSDLVSITTTLVDDKAEIESVARFDDGSDDSLASRSLAEEAVLKGIGKIVAIEPVRIKGALQKISDEAIFTFSRSWKVPVIILNLKVGRMAMKNLSFLVADDQMSAEPLIIGRPVLEHFNLDTKTLLEKHAKQLDGIDCAEVGNPTTFEGTGLKRIDPFPDPALVENPEKNAKDTVHQALIDLIDDAKANGLPEEYHDEIEALIMEHKAVFCLGLTPDAPAKISPLEIRLSEQARPIKVKLRNYSAEQHKFLSQFTKSLVENNMAYSNPYARWASAPLIVPKPGEAKFRFTVDLRLVNKYTYKYHYPMPMVDHELHKLSDQGIMQISICHTRIGRCLSRPIVKNANHSSLQMECSHRLEYYTSCIPHPGLLDDMLIHAKEIPGLLSDTLVWSPNLSSRNTIRPRRLEGLLQMQPPTTGSHLQQFVCALQWMRSAIPQFTSLTAPLMEFMELVYDRAGSRTKKAVAKIKLSSVGWNNSLTEHFNRCKHSLAHQCTLNHRDMSKRLCVYTDANDSVCSVCKVLRWAVKLSWYEYACFHITREDNRQRIFVVQCIRITQTEGRHASKTPQSLRFQDSLLVDKNGRVWIPNDKVDIQLRICIVGHTSEAGHRGAMATEDAIRSVYVWSSLSEDVKNFTRHCIHCISTTGGDRVPRPFGPAHHGTQANDLLQFDYLELPQSNTGSKYILLLRDDFLSFVWLFPFAEANAENSAEAILEWCSTFNKPKGLMSDGGSHFKNETLRLLCKAMHTPHHFTMPNTPWSN
eukprot:IDg22172t1